MWSPFLLVQSRCLLSAVCTASLFNCLFQVLPFIGLFQPRTFGLMVVRVVRTVVIRKNRAKKKEICWLLYLVGNRIGSSSEAECKVKAVLIPRFSSRSQSVETLCIPTAAMLLKHQFLLCVNPILCLQSRQVWITRVLLANHKHGW